MAAERRLLAQDEFEPILKSHHPLIEEAPVQELIELAKWLRARRNRARDIIRGRRRVASGKEAGRGTASETASERGLAAKKQVFAAALARVNARLAHLQAVQRRELAQARLRAALERKQGTVPHHPHGGSTSGGGMALKGAARRRKIVQASRIGSISQSVRTSQAARDSRPG